MDNISSGKISRAFRNALKKGFVRSDDSAVILYDLSFLKERIMLLKSCFPSNTLHGLAIKACPLAQIMDLTRDLGCGVEAASIGEVRLALHRGLSPGMIVYDSPVKTPEEIEFALRQGIHLNLDNFSELERVKIEMGKWRNGEMAKSTVGIRINPQVGEGTIAESSVAGEYSKFGVPLRSRKEEIIRAFLENDFLTGIHLHVGSQGCSLELLTEGSGKLYDLMLEINRLTLERKGREQIRIFDIGGGLLVSYFSDKQAVSMEAYVDALKRRAPLLFGSGGDSLNEGVRLMTEFGRWTYTNAGTTVSRVEYVKHDPGVNTAMIHVGADLFLRECLNPKDWRHEYTALDQNGCVMEGASGDPWNLAGPLCFSGDILAKGVSLPNMKEGDHLVIHDTGSYTFSMWSRYNSRFAPRILGYYNDGESFVILKEKESMDDIIRFWE
jgi:diaminopimelate decarboxylase